MVLSALSTATAGASGAAKATPPKTVSKDEFLQLFVTQLRNQDPLSPMDGAGFTAQLAQFSSLEQLTNISDGLKSLLLFQNSLQNTLTPNLIGKQVGYQGKDSTGADAVLSGTVTGIAFDADRTWLVVDGATRIQPGDVKEIRNNP